MVAASSRASATRITSTPGVFPSGPGPTALPRSTTGGTGESWAGREASSPSYAGCSPGRPGPISSAKTPLTQSMTGGTERKLTLSERRSPAKRSRIRRKSPMSARRKR